MCFKTLLRTFFIIIFLGITTLLAAQTVYDMPGPKVISDSHAELMDYIGKSAFFMLVYNPDRQLDTSFNGFAISEFKSEGDSLWTFFFSDDDFTKLPLFKSCISYDTTTEIFTKTWIDSVKNFTINMQGNRNPDYSNQILFEGSAIDPKTGQEIRFREEHTLKNRNMRRIKFWYDLGAGEYHGALEINKSP